MKLDNPENQEMLDLLLKSYAEELIVEEFDLALDKHTVGLNLYGTSKSGGPKTITLDDRVNTLSLNKIYLGKRGNPVFVFTPLDSRVGKYGDIETVEISREIASFFVNAGSSHVMQFWDAGIALLDEMIVIYGADHPGLVERHKEEFFSLHERIGNQGSISAADNTAMLLRPIQAVVDVLNTILPADTTADPVTMPGKKKREKPSSFVNNPLYGLF